MKLHKELKAKIDACFDVIQNNKKLDLEELSDIKGVIIGGPHHGHTFKLTDHFDYITKSIAHNPHNLTFDLSQFKEKREIQYFFVNILFCPMTGTPFKVYTSHEFVVHMDFYYYQLLVKNFVTYRVDLLKAEEPNL